jgi:hypothetical protein
MDHRFEVPPDIPLWRLALRRPSGLAAGGTIPRIDARAARLRGDLEAYRRVCGFMVTSSIPLPYPNVLARGLQLAVLSAPEFPLPVLGIVHVRQRIVQRRAIGEGEALSAHVWVEGHRVVRRGGEFDLHTVLHVGEEEVWRGETTILSRSIQGDGQKRTPLEVPALEGGRQVEWQIPADVGRRYAAVSGDGNPIHTSWIGARAFGFPRPIAHGWWLLARAIAEMGTDVPAVCSLEARFVSPVALPSTVVFQSGATTEGIGFEIAGKDRSVVGTVRALSA